MSVVYFIQCGGDGPIKIGTARNAKARLKDLSTASPYPLHLLATVPGTYVLEYRIHDTLIGECTNGEWFRPCPRVLAYVACAKDAPLLLEHLIESFEAEDREKRSDLERLGRILPLLISTCFAYLRDTVGLRDVAEQSGINQEHLRKLCHGQVGIGIARALAVQTGFPSLFSPLDAILRLPPAEIVKRFGEIQTVEEMREALRLVGPASIIAELMPRVVLNDENAPALTKARDAIDAQLDRLKPRSVA